MKLAPTFRLWAFPIVVVWLTVCAAGGILAVEGALHPARHVTGKLATINAGALAATYHAALKEARVRAGDGTPLRGWSIQPSAWNGDAVILLHGQTDNRAGMLGKASMLLRHGYAVLLPDARAHGESGGNLATYGVREAADIRDWFNWLRQEQAPRCIDGLGESMGAAQLLVSLREEPDFCAVVAESPFASFREASYDRLGEMLQAGPWAGRFPLRPALEAGFLYARWKYGVDLEQASPRNTVAHSSIPVLLIHGENDTNLPIVNSQLILASSAGHNPMVSLWAVAGAEHCGAQDVMPAEFERRVITWLETHDKPGKSS